MEKEENVWKRFFIVFYIGNSDTNSRLTGLINFRTTGSYLNLKICEEQISENIGAPISQICFTNIIELSEEDYNTFYFKE